MNLWSFYFGWYQGAVYSNLLASGICAAGAVAVAVWRARVHLERHREAVAAERAVSDAAHAERHARTHELLASIHERLSVEMPPEDET